MCPKCDCETVKVLESRKTVRGVRRRRQCEACDTTFTTLETVMRVIAAKFRPPPETAAALDGGVALASAWGRNRADQ